MDFIGDMGGVGWQEGGLWSGRNGRAMRKQPEQQHLSITKKE